MSYITRLLKNQKLLSKIILASENIALNRTSRPPNSIFEGYQEITQKLTKNKNLITELKNDLHNEIDTEMKALFQEEINENLEIITDHHEELLEFTIDELLPYRESQLLFSQLDLYVSGCVLTFKGAIGGDEATMFANELKDGYQVYINSKNWDSTSLTSETDGLADVHDVSKLGVRGNFVATTSFIQVDDDEAFDYLKTEGGFHRVQRVPYNSKNIQTSTVSIEVTPLFDSDSDGVGLFAKNIDKVVDYMQKSPDIKIEHFKKGSGAGGQNVNTGYTGRRVTFLPMNITAEAAIKDEYATLKECGIMLRAEASKQMWEEREKLLLLDGTNLPKVFSRTDKIRSYNFPDKRIRDHRLGSETTLLGTSCDDWIASGEFDVFTVPLMELREYEEFERRLDKAVASYV